MALNKYMHPRNIYKTRKPDFKQLAIKYDYFREKVTQNLSGKVILDFKDPSALRALTRALLEEDFGILVTLPVDRLIPTVPQRLNYILWLEDILGTEAPAKGIDIGTGSSCIYPLLGCKKNGWQFLASEVDDQNMMFATQNVQKNNMQDNITIKKVSEDKLLLGVVDESQTYDFSMCNPPFFSDHLEAQGISATRTDDRPVPKTLSTASEKESIAWGGEVRFVCQMIEESLVLKDKIRVYTSLLGKKMSLSLIKDQLARKKITRFSSTEFCQGRTMRWGIAWTFDEAVNFPKSTFKELKKPNVPLTFEVPRGGTFVKEYTVQAFTEFVRSQIEELKINYHVKHSGKFYSYFMLQAKENTWSHQRRKRRKEKFSALNKSPETDSRVGADAFIDKSLGQSNYDEVRDSQMIELDNALLQKGKSDTAKLPDEKGETISIGDGKGDNQSGEINLNKDACQKSGAEIDLVNIVSQTKEIGTKENSNLGCMDSGNDTENVKNLKDLQNKLTKETENVQTGADSKDEVKALCSKRKLEDTMSEHDQKKIKTVDSESNNDEMETKASDLNIETQSTQKDKSVSEDQTQSDNKVESNIGNPENSSKDNKDKVVTDKKDKLLAGDESNTNDTDPNRMKSRAEIAKEFFAEQEANSQKAGNKKRVPHSVYEKLEGLNDTDECLVLLKLMIRKDEGTVSLSFTHMAGAKEALHQIMQYFRNKLV